MSEPIAGVVMPEMPARPPIDAAAVILYRHAPGGVEVFWLKREKALKFAGGFFAFAGGKLDKADASIPVAGAEGLEAALRVTAARELFEETGVLMGANAHAVPGPTKRAWRTTLLAKTRDFASLLQEGGVTLRASDFPAAGRWLTPPFLPVRFDARFFLVECPASEAAEVWPGELSFGEWISPAVALGKWADGVALLHPPNQYAMETMAEFSSVAGALEKLKSPPYCQDFVAERLQFQRGIHLFPLQTPTLPPATHTNVLVLGTGELLVVDPGAADGAETDRLARMLEEMVREGRHPLAVVLTHHHSDHIGGAERIAERFHLPVWAHAETAKRLSLRVSRHLEEGEVLALAGALPMRFRVHHTPGHAVGHICLIDEHSHAAVVGDMVAGVGTIVIDPPEGDMAEYLKQLERLKTLGVRTLYPAHGPVIPEGVEKLDEYLVHRAWRETKVVDALSAEFQPLEDVVPRAYDDVQSLVWPLAERNTLAILTKLVREKKAQRDAAGRYARG